MIDSHGAGRSDPLRWIAASLVGCWCLAGLAYGLYGVAEKTVEIHALSSPGPWHNPFPLGLDLAIFTGWMLTLNVLFAGWIVGLTAIIRGGQRRLIRSLTFTMILVAAVSGEFWITSWNVELTPLPTAGLVHDPRLQFVLICVISLVVAGTAMFLLGLLARRKPSVSYLPV